MSVHAPSELVRVRLSPDRLRALLVLEPGIDAATPIEAIADSMLAGAGVPSARRRPGAIREAVETYRRDPARRLEAVVAEARPPLHGEDGRLELCPEVRGLLAAAAANPAVLPLVTKGQRLGRLHVPGPAEDGEDVLGRILAARPGRPAPVATDATVRVVSGEVFAAVDGLLEHAAGALRVRNELVIDGGVDRATGDVDFPGDITIRLGVCDCSTVRARGKLVVHGPVDAATLIAGADAELDGGMAARQMGAVEIGGTLRAKHLAGVQGEVAGDLEVRSEIVSCRLIVTGRCLSGVCALIGGELTVASDCVLSRLGSESWTPTRLVLGRHGRLHPLLERGNELRPLLAARIEAIRQQLAQAKAGGRNLSHDRAELITELGFELAAKQGKLAEVDAVIASLVGRIQRSTRVCLRVRHRIFPGTRLVILGDELQVVREIRGPVQLDLDERARPRLIETTTNTELPISRFLRSADRAGTPCSSSSLRPVSVPSEA